MPVFGKISKQRLGELHPFLQEILEEAIKTFDFAITCGFRGEKEQNEAYKKGASTKKWPNSKHNKKPSMAVDIAPFPIDWNDHKRFDELAKLILSIATQKGMDIEWGGHWKKPVDKPHFQLNSISRSTLASHLPDIPSEEEILDKLKESEPS